MQFVQVSGLINAYFEAKVHKNVAFEASCLYLSLTSKSPVEFKDTNNVPFQAGNKATNQQLEKDIRMKQGAVLKLEKLSLNLDFGSEPSSITKCEVTAQKISLVQVISETVKEQTQEPIIPLEGMSLTLVTKLVDRDDLALIPMTRRYLRRIQKAKLSKKKGFSTLNAILYIPQKFEDTQVRDLQEREDDPTDAELEEESYSSIAPNPRMGKIDEESLVLLDHLLDFVDKQAIMEVMVNRMMKAKHHKRAARTMIFPTLNIERDNTKVYKKMYGADTIAELLSGFNERFEEIDN